MKHFICGLVSICVVCGYSNVFAECTGCDDCEATKTKQVIRIKAAKPGEETLSWTAKTGSGSTSAGKSVSKIVVAPSVSVTTGDETSVYMNGMRIEPNSLEAGSETAGYLQNGELKSLDYWNDKYDDGDYNESVSGGKSTSLAYLHNKHDIWYFGGRLGLSFLNWRNKYSALPAEAIVDMSADHDDYRFKPVVEANLFVGYRFSPAWRSDLEFSFTSSYSDSDNGITFELSVPSLVANVYYDFMNGLYIGGGLGVSFPTISLDWAYFVANGSSKTGTTLTGALMAGYTHYVSDSLILDLRYRISGMNGPSLRRSVYNFGALESVETKVGFILENSISIGLRYEF